MENTMLATLLQPWSYAGLEYLLAETDLPTEWSLCCDISFRKTPSRPGRPARAGIPVPDRSPQIPQRPLERQSLSVSVAVPADGPVHSVVDTWQRQTKNITLPLIWQQRLAATRPGAVLWTYRGLGTDLCVTPNVQRRMLFQRLLMELGHKAGTHSFWPTALPDPNSTEDDGLSTHTEAFWHGVEALGSRALVVLGSRALQALCLPRRLRPFQQARIDGRMIIVLPDPDILIQEPHRYTAVREYLRQALLPYARR